MTQFEEMVAASERTTQRFEAAVNEIQSQSVKLIDVNLSRAEIGEIPAVKAYVFGNEEALDPSWLEAAAALPSIRKRKAQLEAAEAVRQGDADEIEKINKLPRHVRMTVARRDGLDEETRQHVEEVNSVANEAFLLRQCLSLKTPQARINFARKHGLV